MPNTVDLQPGPKLDARVARAMGWERVEWDLGWDWGPASGHRSQHDWNPSTSNSDAIEALETCKRYRITKWSQGYSVDAMDNSGNWHEVMTPTLAHAAALAVVRAKEAENG